MCRARSTKDANGTLVEDVIVGEQVLEQEHEQKVTERMLCTMKQQIL